MANNYLQFSEIIFDLTPPEKQWLMEVLDQPEPASLKDNGINPKHIEVDDWPGFQWELMDDKPNLWIYSEECGNLSHVGEVVKAFLARHRPNASFTLTWSETCSKLRASEFGGGGLFVTAKAVKEWRAGNVVYQMKHRFENPSRKSI